MTAQAARLAALEARAGVAANSWDPVLYVPSSHGFADEAAWERAVAETVAAAPPPPPGYGYMCIPSPVPEQVWEQRCRQTQERLCVEEAERRRQRDGGSHAR